MSSGDGSGAVDAGALVPRVASTLGGWALGFEGGCCVAAEGPPGLEGVDLADVGRALDPDTRARLRRGLLGPVQGALVLEAQTVRFAGEILREGSRLWLVARPVETSASVEARLEPFRRAFQEADFAISITRGEPPHDVVYVNPAFERFIGLSFEELEGRNLRLLQAGTGGQDEARQSIRQALEAGESCQVLLRNWRPGGETFDNQLTIVPIFGDRERPDFFLGLQRDVTAEVRAQRELARERRLLAEAERVAGCGTWQWDARTGEVWWSPGIFALLERDPALGPVPLEAQREIYPHEHHRLVAMLEACARDGQPRALDLQIRSEGGRVFWAEARAQQLVEEDGRVRLLGTLVDIEARKAHEQELKATALALEDARARAERADRAKSAFIANMSHEIRTPLHGLLGAAGLLEQADLDISSRELARTILSSGEALLRIINDVLDLSKMEAGHLELESRAFDVEDLLEEVLSLLAPRARERGDRLGLMVEPGAPTQVEGDPTRLRQVLLNLVGNAVKFTEGGEVEVSLARAGAGGLRFEVRDTGIGFDPALKTRLFRPFMQADASTTRHFGGTGLGLSICRQLVELMGGEIDAESAPGEGTTFFFTLPFARLEARPADDRLAGVRVGVEGAPLSARGRVARILVGAGATLVEPHAAEVVFRVYARPDAAPSEGPGRVHVWPAPPEEARTAGVHLVEPARRAVLVEACQVAAEATPRRRVELGATPEPPRTELRVLLVDDNPVNRKVGRLILRRLGVDAAVVDGGLAAVEACRVATYDLVLMDLQMPDIDGYEATRRIRAAEGHQPVVVALTASTLADAEDEALGAGMNAFLSKPIRLEDLRRILDNLGSRPQGEASAPHA